MSENNKTKKEAMPYIQEIQKKIFAVLLFDKRASEGIHLVIPEHFDNPALKDMTNLIIGFHEKYSRIPTEDEFSQELVSFITKSKEKSKNFPEPEYLDIFDEIKSLKDSNFEYSWDLFQNFAQAQAYGKTILKLGKLYEKGDLNGITRVMNEAVSIGSDSGGLRILSDIETKDVVWLWEDHIPLGEITLLIGDPGTGKSYFSYFLSAQVSRGGSWPDDPDNSIESGKVLILSTDEDPNYAIRPRSDAAGADIKNIVVLEGSRDEKGRIKILNLTNEVHRLEEILKKDKSYRLVIIDPLSDYIGHVDTHKYSDVRWALAPLIPLARKDNIAIVGIMHCNKNVSLQVLYRIMGSMGFASVARSIWIIAKDRSDEENKRRYFSPLKANLAPEQNTLAFYLENLGKVAKIIFEKEPMGDDFDIEEMLVPQERAGETKRAKKFLLEVLKDGAMSTKDVKSATDNEGLSWNTVKKVKIKMGIQAVKEKKAGGKWYWVLKDFDRYEALAEVHADSMTIHERVDKIREEHENKKKESQDVTESEPEKTEEENK